MGADLRKEAQKRVDRVALFREELAELAREGGLTLTLEQQSGLDVHLEALLSRLHQQYGVDATESARRISWGIRVAALLGAAALLAAGILFLHRVWGHVSTPLQVMILTTAPLGLLLAAEIAHTRRADLYYVGLIALAAGVAFVLEINALGAVLNLRDSPLALLAWGCFAVLIAYAYGLRLLLGAGLVLVCAWSGAMVMHLQGYHWVEFMAASQLLIPGAVVVYSVPWLRRGCGPEGFAAVYRLCGGGVGLLALFVLSVAGDLCCGGIPAATVAAAYQVIGLLAGVAVVFHGLRCGQAALVNVGAIAFVVFLFARLHAWWWHWMPKYMFCLVLGLIAFLLLVVFRRLRRRPSGLPDRLWTAAGSASSPQPDLETSHHLRRAFLVGAASLVVLADGWGVRQAVQNRAAVLGGTLQLTEREARLQPVALESSVTMLRLNWRTEGSDAERFRAPAWLNTNKITELGFDCGVQLKNDLRARRHYGSQPPRQVFLVMAYRGDTADSTDPRGQAKTGLVVVDAGRDPRQLRERYPDPQEYIICRGLAGLRFRTHDHGGGLLDTPVLEGFIADACPAEASVPKPINRVLLAVRRTVSQEEGAPPSEPRFSAWIHWGRNYEPWVDEVRALSK